MVDEKADQIRDAADSCVFFLLRYARGCARDFNPSNSRGIKWYVQKMQVPLFCSVRLQRADSNMQIYSIDE